MQIIDYIKESKGEFAHISWPTRQQAVAFTVLVIVLSIATSVYLGLFDTLFTTIIKKFII
jgi:preprotein translocase SecE subunit